MKKIFYILALMSVSLLTVAQDADVAEEEKDGWKKGGVATLTFSQVAMDNWAAGGQNSVSGVALFNGFANYTQGNHVWDNNLIFGYGLMKQGDDDWYKSNDRIEFASKYGLKARENWYYSALLDFKTQFSEGYADAADVDHISSFFAPAYTNLALGMDYKPNDNFSVFISPFSGKLTFVNDTALSNSGSFGVDAGESLRAEFGAFVKIAYKVDLMENVNYTTKIDFFSNYLNNPANVDVNWDNLVTFKINDYLNASFMFSLIYDDDILFDEVDSNDIVIKQGPKVQWKEMFGLGLSYTL